MKKKLFALLLVIPALLVSALCFSEETSYTCDSCDYYGICDQITVGTRIVGDKLQEHYVIKCPKCDNVITDKGWHEPVTAPSGDSSGNGGTGTQGGQSSGDGGDNGSGSQGGAAQTGDSSGGSGTNTQGGQPSGNGGDNGSGSQGNPPQTGNSSGEGGEEPAVILPPEGGSSGNEGEGSDPPVLPPQPAEETKTDPLPPVAPDRPAAPAQAAPAPEPQPAAAPAPQEPVNDPPPAPPSGPVRRNLRKYPAFSSAYPSRRLNMPGDPEAWAPIPGEKIYPADPEEGSSILQRMLHGN